MGELDKGAAAEVDIASAGASLEETFQHTMGDGTVLTIGKPQQVLKMRLRKILGDNYRDLELRTIATMFLSIRQAVGSPVPRFEAEIQFEGFMARFGTDENLEDCMAKFSKMLNPAETEIVQTAILEALEQGLDERATEALIRERTLPLAKKRLEAVRDS